MVIAVNTRILSGDTAASKLFIDYFTNLAAINQDHEFYFISASDAIPVSSVGNIKSIVLKQQSANPLLWKLWYNYKLPAVLKKIKATVLVSVDGVCSLRTKVSQVVLANDMEFLQHQAWYSKRYLGFISTNMLASLHKVEKIITFSEFYKNEIRGRFAIQEDKVTVVPYKGSKNFAPITWEEKERIKEKYTAGNEYFFFNGAIHDRSNLLNLLKAFSMFKKRQKSSMQLLLLTGNIPQRNQFVESLRLYKYRNDVQLITGLGEPDVVSLTAASLCAVNLSPLFSDICSLQNALCCEVPVIARLSPQAKELFGEAALYADASSVDSIADKLMMVYKDENKQMELVQKAKELNAVNKVDQLWQNIVSVAGDRMKI